MPEIGWKEVAENDLLHARGGSRSVAPVSRAAARRRLMNSLRCLLTVQCDGSNIIIETVAGSLVQLCDEAPQEVRT